MAGGAGEGDGERALMREMGLTVQDIERRKHYVALTDQDLKRIAGVRDGVLQSLSELSGSFFTYLSGLEESRAKVVVVDVTGVAAVDSQVADHLLQTVAAARLIGAQAIVTGISSNVAQARVALRIELGQLNTVGDLQGGLEEAERLLGYRVMPGCPDDPVTVA